MQQGRITVTANKTAGAASSTPTLCISTPLTAITHATTGATGIGTPTNLPAGVTCSMGNEYNHHQRNTDQQAEHLIIQYHLQEVAEQQMQQGRSLSQLI